MNAIVQFVLFNLLPSLIAGLILWGVVVTSIRALGIGYGRLRLSLLYAPAIKSLLVLLGMAAVLPWPGIFSGWQERALDIDRILPWLLIWLGVAMFGRQAYLHLAERRTLARARSPHTTTPRLSNSLRRAQESLRNSPVEVTGEVACCTKRDLPPPRILLHNGIISPLAIPGGAMATIVFPADLVPELTDEELDCVMAHELAHLMLRNPAWCSPEATRHVSAVIPVSHLLAARLNYEEEKACDDMAVAALGEPEIYAAMLLKSYRFAKARSRAWRRAWQVLPQLLGARPVITQRVERLLEGQGPGDNLRFQAAATCLLWAGLIVLAF